MTVRGQGKGGRNQELALMAALRLDGLEDVAVVCLATDGTDGLTDASGALATGDTLARARAQGLDAWAHLENNDAYPFFAALDDLLLTGPTHTNVNDLIFVVRRPAMIDPTLPLIDLHRHLDGAVRLQTIVDLGRQHNLPLPSFDLEELRPHVQVTTPQPGVMAFLQKFKWMVGVLVDYDACRRIAYENVQDAQREGIAYIELRFSPEWMARPHNLDVAGCGGGGGGRGGGGGAGPGRGRQPDRHPQPPLWSSGRS